MIAVVRHKVQNIVDVAFYENIGCYSLTSMKKFKGSGSEPLRAGSLLSFSIAIDVS